MAIRGVSSYSGLIVDYTIDPIGSGADGADVDQSFVIAGTSPILIDGGASSDMTTSPLTISVQEFGPANDGIVPSPGVATTTFLRADGTWTTEQTFAGATPGLVPGGSGASAAVFLSGAGTWVAGAVAGVASVTGTAPIVVSPTTGAAVVSISAANLATPGHVPAVGSVDTTHALLRTNPPTWGAVSASGFIQLQASYPGTAQTGGGHVTGVFGAQTAVVAGSNKRGLNGLGSEPLYVKQPNALNCPVIASYVTSATITPGLAFRAARGTEAVPVVPNSGDELLRISSSTYSGTGSVYFDRDILTVTAGSTGTGPGLGTTLRGWATDSHTAYLHLSKNALAGIGTFTPVSGFEIATSLGLSTHTITGTSFSATTSGTADTDCVYLCDATASVSTLQLIELATAAGRQGRVYSLIKIDATSKAIEIGAGGGSLINGINLITLSRRGDGVTLISDGTNYQILNKTTSYERFSSVADGSAVANTVVETNLYDMANPDITNSEAGLIARMFGYGKFSTTGTPTARFRVYSKNGDMLADSGAVTLPNGVTDAVWQFEFTSSARTNPNNAPRWPIAKISISQAAGVGAEMKAYNMIDLAITSTPALSGGIPRRLTVTWGTASASNTIQCLSMVRSQTDTTTLV